jgi:hypothetical protein
VNEGATLADALSFSYAEALQEWHAVRVRSRADLLALQGVRSGCE